MREKDSVAAYFVQAMIHGLGDDPQRLAAALEQFEERRLWRQLPPEGQRLWAETFAPERFQQRLLPLLEMPRLLQLYPLGMQRRVQWCLVRLVGAPLPRGDQPATGTEYP